MRIRLISCLVALVAASALSGCTNNEGPNYQGVPGSSWNGIYVQSIPDNLVAAGSYDVLTAYVNYPEIEMVITPNGSAIPSFMGSSTTGLSNQLGVFRYNLTLKGTSGQVAQANGFLTATQAGPNSLNVQITGAISYAFNVGQFNTTTNADLVGTYSGSYTSSFAAGGSTTTEPAGTVSNLTLVADNNTGGYDMNAGGATTDPSGKAVNFAITNAQVDPAGIISGLKVTYSYPGGSPASVTNTYATAFVDLGLVANQQGISSSTTLVGYWNAPTTNWPGGASETDTLVLTQSSAMGRRPAIRAGR